MKQRDIPAWVEPLARREPPRPLPAYLYGRGYSGGRHDPLTSWFWLIVLLMLMFS